MLIILDAGHGILTDGKRSPVWPNGSQLFEGEFNRDIVRRIKDKLDRLNIQSIILVPEIEDISLAERCKRANAIYDTNQNCLLLSIHANAGGGTGWEAYTSIGNTKADHYATILYSVAKEGLSDGKIRSDYSDGDPDKEEGFYILKHTKCPAILTENLFMDNQKDCAYLMTTEGREHIADMYVNFIIKLQ